MLEIGYQQLHGWIAALLWPLVRVMAFIAASPLWGHASVPASAKIGLALLVSILLQARAIPVPDVPIFSWAGFGILIEQTLIGISLGLAVRITLAVAQAAGDFIGLQMGLAFAVFFSPDTGANTMIVSRILYVITLLMFFAVDGHLMTLEAVATSFSTLPIGTAGLNPDAFILLVRFGGTVIASGLLLALPLVTALLIVNLSLGILNRSAPQLTIFSVGFPASLTLGLLLLMLLMSDLGRFLHALFTQGLTMLTLLIEALAPIP